LFLIGVIFYKNTIIIFEIVSKANNLHRFHESTFSYLLRPFLFDQETEFPINLKKQQFEPFNYKTPD
jgi:hypothetical protein